MGTIFTETEPLGPFNEIEPLGPFNDASVRVEADEVCCGVDSEASIRTKNLKMVVMTVLSLLNINRAKKRHLSVWVSPVCKKCRSEDQPPKDDAQNRATKKHQFTIDWQQKHAEPFSHDRLVGKGLSKMGGGVIARVISILGRWGVGALKKCTVFKKWKNI